MTKKIFLLSVLAVCVLALGACTAVTTPAANTNAADTNAAPSDNQVGLANPASVNCETVGGQLKLETKTYNGEDLGQIGVCYFEDNRQCEEWALFRGECPAGGLKITGYVTEAGRFCAITGGEYAITKQDSGAGDEEGTCTKAGVACPAWEYYAGTCPTIE